MADNYNIYEYCKVCKGTGTITINSDSYDPGPPEDIDCNLCAGEGKILWGVMLKQEKE